MTKTTLEKKSKLWNFSLIDFPKAKFRTSIHISTNSTRIFSYKFFMIKVKNEENIRISSIFQHVRQRQEVFPGNNKDIHCITYDMQFELCQSIF